MTWWEIKPRLVLGARGRRAVWGSTRRLVIPALQGRPVVVMIEELSSGEVTSSRVVKAAEFGTGEFLAEDWEVIA
jgi:hypothetical protein